MAHPLPVGAVLVLALNDHVLKGSGLLPEAVTGKLSDVAGLFFFPVALAAVLVGASRWFGRPMRERLATWVAALLTALVFAALKVWPALNGLLGAVWGPNSMDRTDLLCLPVTALVPLWIARATPYPIREWTRLAVILVTGLATMATQTQESIRRMDEQRRREVFHWQPGERHDLSCASVELKVAEHRYKNVRIVLQLETLKTTCALTVAHAEVNLPFRTVPVASLPATVQLRKGAPAYLQLEFPDEERFTRQEYGPVGLSIAVTAPGQGERAEYAFGEGADGPSPWRPPAPAAK